MYRKGRGQILVIVAVLIPVVVLFFLFALGLAALLDVRAHATDALNVATRAGARQVAYAEYGQGTTQLVAEEVERQTKETFARALALRTMGLADTAESIAQDVQVEVGYGSPLQPWPSPFVKNRKHRFPTVAAQARVPIRVWMFEVTLPIVSETEVK